MKVDKFIRKLQDIPCVREVKIEDNTIRICCNDRKDAEYLKIVEDSISEGKIKKSVAKFALNRLQDYSNFQKEKIEKQDPVIKVLEEVISKLITLRNEMTE